MAEYRKIKTNNKLSVVALLEGLHRSREAYNAYLDRHNWNDLVNFIDTLDNFPKDKVPKNKSAAIRVINKLAEKFKDSVTSSDFLRIFDNLDDILKLDAGPQGAVLQNLVKACVKRIADLEKISIEGAPDKKIEDSIIKYISEVRLLMASITAFSEDIQQSRNQIKKYVEDEIIYILNAVKESFVEVAPTKLSEFQASLQAKLTTLYHTFKK